MINNRFCEFATMLTDNSKFKTQRSYIYMLIKLVDNVVIINYYKIKYLYIVCAIFESCDFAKFVKI